jgi:hypothetical protein
MSKRALLSIDSGENLAAALTLCKGRRPQRLGELTARGRRLEKTNLQIGDDRSNAHLIVLRRDV